MKIGIPRAFAYYAYYPFICTFLERLGVEVIVSEKTNKEITDQGVKYAITDACVPLKIFHGHVLNLMDRVDYVIVPRLVSVTREATFCPKFLGLPDMLLCSIPDFNNMLEVRIDLKKGRFELFLICMKLARRLRKGFITAYRAYLSARYSFKNYAHQFLQGGIPSLGILGQKKTNSLCLGIVGYPYMLYDSYLSLDLIKKLIDMGAYIMTPEMVSKRDKAKQAIKFKKDTFWTFSNGVLRTAFHFLEKRCVDGIIHLTAFGCGPDFIVDKIIELECKNLNTPYLTIAFDEHTGQEGLNTRLEAFVDMLKIKKQRKEAALA